MASLAQIQRDAARAEAARQRAQAASRRAADQARARYERSAAADERERKRLYAESRTADVAAMNAELADTIAALDGVLAATLESTTTSTWTSSRGPPTSAAMAMHRCRHPPTRSTARP